MSRLIVGPFNRVEGDLEVSLSIKDGMVEEARVVSPLYRGFEQMLRGKAPEDALVLAPRICGICSISQSVAAARALEALTATYAPRNGQLSRNLISAMENVADHLTHFYLFFMPDFTRETYQTESWFEDIQARFRAIKGTATQSFLPQRASFMHLAGILAGKWPHSLAIQPGGLTRTIAAHEQARLKSILFVFRRFLEQDLFGMDLDAVGEMQSVGALEDWLERVGQPHCDFARFLFLSRSLKLRKLGRSYDHFLSFGAYPFKETDGDPAGEQPLWRAGQVRDGTHQPFDSGAITEDVANSWMMPDSEPRHPFDGRTDPQTQLEGGYSWCKAPRLAGESVEVGALARQVVNQHPLITDAVASFGGNVESRVLARLLEVALLVPRMQEWVEKLDPNAPFRTHPGSKPDGQAFGLVEAARGSLGHWMVVKGGLISNYQIIAPTTWNFSPRDHTGQAGPLELALEGAPLRTGEETDPVSVQHIVRSFDPCMVCTVH